MKVFCLSDLHLEGCKYHWLKKNLQKDSFPKADVCSLAGDIFNLSNLTPNKEKEYDEFFQKLNDSYKRTYIVAGNHTFYGSDINEAVKKEKSYLNKFPNIMYLDNEMEYYNGVLFIGTTLWSSFNKQNPISMTAASQFMNDYRLIRNGDRRLVPFDTYDLFRMNAKFLEKAIYDNPKVKIFLITHHAFSLRSIHEKYKYEHEINGAFGSDLEYLLKPQVKVAHHGHMHDSFHYKIDGTEVICNPLGYRRTGGFENTMFDPKFTIEI